MNNLIVKENNQLIANENNMGSEMFLQKCTLDLEKKENKIKLYNSLQKCDVLLNDIKGETIKIVDVYIEGKQVPERDSDDNILYNDNTGEVKTKKKYRIMLFDDEGKSYVTAAYGVFNSLVRIISIFGDPSNENPFKVKVEKQKIRNTGKESLVLILINE